MSGIFNASIFNNAVFNTGTAGPVVIPEVVKTGTGGIDPERKRRTIYKPTGLPWALKKPQGQEGVEQRILETRDIHREILGEIQPRVELQEVSFKPIEAMSSAEIDREIGILMREKLAKEDEEDTMTVLMMALND